MLNLADELRNKRDERVSLEEILQALIEDDPKTCLKGGEATGMRSWDESQILARGTLTQCSFSELRPVLFYHPMVNHQRLIEDSCDPFFSACIGVNLLESPGEYDLGQIHDFLQERTIFWWKADVARQLEKHGMRVPHSLALIKDEPADREEIETEAEKQERQLGWRYATAEDELERRRQEREQKHDTEGARLAKALLDALKVLEKRRPTPTFIEMDGRMFDIHCDIFDDVDVLPDRRKVLEDLMDLARPRKGTAKTETAEQRHQEPAGQAVRPLTRAEAQDAAILKKLRELGYDPQRLPKRKPGMSGPRAKVRAALGTAGMWSGKKVFDKAWQRLRDIGEIAGAE